MENLTTLIEKQKRCTDPKEYDRLSAAIAEANKAGSLARAAQLAAIEAQQAAERKAAEAEYSTLTAEIGKYDAEILDQDNHIFELVKELTERVNKRLDLSRDALELETAAENMARMLHVPFTDRTAGLFGGRPIRNNFNDFVKVWLQRFSDWSFRAGGTDKVTREQIASHGLRSSTESQDQIHLF